MWTISAFGQIVMYIFTSLEILVLHTKSKTAHMNTHEHTHTHTHTHTERERKRNHTVIYFFLLCFLATLCVPVIHIEGKKMFTWIMHNAQRTLHFNFCLKSRHKISQPFHLQPRHFFHLLTACWWIKYGTEFSHMLICWTHMKFSSFALEGRISIETWKLPTAQQ